MQVLVTVLVLSVTTVPFTEPQDSNISPNDFAAGKAAHAWYVCFAPAKEPELALVVLMENVGTGGKYALPAARKVLEDYYLDVPVIK